MGGCVCATYLANFSKNIFPNQCISIFCISIVYLYASFITCMISNQIHLSQMFILYKESIVKGKQTNAIIRPFLHTIFISKQWLHETVESTILFWYPHTKVELPWGDCNGESKPVEQVEDRRGTLRRLFEGVEAAMHDMLLSETDTTRLCVAWLVEVQDTSESRVSLVSSAVSTDDVTTSLNWTVASKLVDLVTLLWPFRPPLDFDLSEGDARVVEFVPRVVSDTVRSGPTILQMTEAEFSIGPSCILR